jgi:vancomycin permeability regulator SanA
MYNITETVGHLFLDNLLNCSICLGYSITKTTFQNNIVLIRITTGYSLGKWGNVNLNLSNNHVGSGDNINPGYTEFQGMLQYDINF